MKFQKDGSAPSSVGGHGVKGVKKSKSPVKGRPAQKGDPLECFFMCGVTRSVTKCPVVEGQTIQWEFPDGNGRCCFFCAAAYRAKLKSKFTRDQVKEKMMDSKDFMDSFFLFRDQAIEKARKR